MIHGQFCRIAFQDKSSIATKHEIGALCLNEPKSADILTYVRDVSHNNLGGRELTQQRHLTGPFLTWTCGTHMTISIPNAENDPPVALCHSVMNAHTNTKPWQTCWASWHACFSRHSRTVRSSVARRFGLFQT